MFLTAELVELVRGSFSSHLASNLVKTANVMDY